MRRSWWPWLASGVVATGVAVLWLRTPTPVPAPAGDDSPSVPAAARPRSARLRIQRLAPTLALAEQPASLLPAAPVRMAAPATSPAASDLEPSGTANPPRLGATGPASAPVRASEGFDGGTQPVYAATRAGIRSAIRAAVPQLRDCYEPWLRADPDLGGHGGIAFTIGPEGQVQNAKLRVGGFGNAALDGCVLSVFMDLRFQPPVGGKVTVMYPISLLSAADGGA